MRHQRQHSCVCYWHKCKSYCSRWRHRREPEWEKKCNSQEYHLQWAWLKKNWDNFSSLFNRLFSFTFFSSTGATFTFHYWKLSSFYHPIHSAIRTALDKNGEINVQLLFNIHTVFDSAVVQQLSCPFDLIVLSICIVLLQARAVKHLCG